MKTGIWTHRTHIKAQWLGYGDPPPPPCNFSTHMMKEKDLWNKLANKACHSKNLWAQVRDLASMNKMDSNQRNLCYQLQGGFYTHRHVCTHHHINTCSHTFTHIHWALWHTPIPSAMGEAETERSWGLTGPPVWSMNSRVNGTLPLKQGRGQAWWHSSIDIKSVMDTGMLKMQSNLYTPYNLLPILIK